MRKFAIICILSTLIPPFSFGEDCCSSLPVIEVEPGKPEPYPHLLYAFNSQLVGSTMQKNGIGIASEQFSQIVGELKPGAVRFPGGTVGNHYLWRIDSFDPPDGLIEWAKKLLGEFHKSGIAYGLDAFIDLSIEKGFEPMWMVNIYKNSPEDVVDLVRHIRARGGSVRYIELGNESYWDKRSHNDVEAYTRYARPIAEALRAEDPSILIGVNIGPFGRRGNYEVVWNEPISRDKSWYDAVIHHEYIGGQGISVDEGRSGPVYDVLYGDREFHHALKETRATHPDMPIWMTEWNVGQGFRRKFGQSPAHLIFQAAVYTFFVIHNDDFALGGLHQIEGDSWGTYVPQKDGGFIRVPSFFMWKKIGELTAGKCSYFPLDLQGVRELPAGVSNLIGFGVGKPDGSKALFLINRDPESIQLVARAIFGCPKQKLVVSTIASEEDVLGQQLPFGEDPWKVTEATPGKVVLPPYSLTVIEAAN